MIVKVMMFARAKEVVGEPVIELVLADEANVGELKQTLVEHYPGLLDVLDMAMISVDREYSNDDRALYHGAEVGIIPPVSGG